MSTKKLLKEFKAMRLKVDAQDGLDARSLVARRLLDTITKTYDLQRQYELMQADNSEATCKKFTDDELDNLKEVKEINRSIGKRLGAIKKAKRKTGKK
jgi:hypothetical protein